MNELLIWGTVSILFFVGLVLYTMCEILVQDHHVQGIPKYITWIKVIRYVILDKEINNER